MCTVLRPVTRQSFVVFLFIWAFLPSFVRSQAVTGKAGNRQTARSPLPAEAEPGQDSPPLDGRDGRDLLLSRFRPHSNLKIKQTLLTHAKFSVVDIHTHFRYRLKHSPERLDEFVKLMDRNNISVCVSLDGKLGDEFDEHAKYLWTKYPDRFLIFANVDWMGNGQRDDPATWDCQREDFAHRTAIA